MNYTKNIKTIVISSMLFMMSAPSQADPTTDMAVFAAKGLANGILGKAGGEAAEQVFSAFGLSNPTPLSKDDLSEAISKGFREEKLYDIKDKVRNLKSEVANYAYKASDTARLGQLNKIDTLVSDIQSSIVGLIGRAGKKENLYSLQKVMQDYITTTNIDLIFKTERIYASATRDAKGKRDKAAINEAKDKMAQKAATSIETLVGFMNNTFYAYNISNPECIHKRKEQTLYNAYLKDVMERPPGSRRHPSEWAVKYCPKRLYKTKSTRQERNNYANKVYAQPVARVGTAVEMNSENAPIYYFMSNLRAEDFKEKKKYPTHLGLYGPYKTEIEALASRFVEFMRVYNEDLGFKNQYEMAAVMKGWKTIAKKGKTPLKWQEKITKGWDGETILNRPFMTTLYKKINRTYSNKKIKRQIALADATSKVKDEKFWIENMGISRCLGWDSKDNDAIYTGCKRGARSQHWFYDESTGYIANEYEAICLAAAKLIKKESYTNAVAEKCKNDNSQKWTYDKIKKTISLRDKNASSKYKCLTGSGTKSRAVALWRCLPTSHADQKSQQWNIRKAPR